MIEHRPAACDRGGRWPDADSMGRHETPIGSGVGPIKAVREDVRAVHSQVLQDALRRIDKVAS